MSTRAGDDDRSTHFERFVRPLFVGRCHQCHAGEMHKGGFWLDISAGLNRGGESGAAVVPGSPDVSLLIQAVRHEQGLRMPPVGRLSERQISDIAQWIRNGAHWPSSEASDAPGAVLPTAVRPLSPDHAAMPASLRLWLRADNLDLRDGDVLTVWPDSSAHRRDMTEVPANEGGQAEFTPPRYVLESSLGRRPGVRFVLTSGLSGMTGDLFDASPDAGLLSLAAPRT